MSHSDAQFDKELEAAYLELDKAQKNLAELRRKLPHAPVSDYQLQSPDGPSISPPCLETRRTSSSSTTWAPAARTARCGRTISTVSPIICRTGPPLSSSRPTALRTSRRSRADGAGASPIYSAQGSTFTADMGFQSTAGGFMSGFQPGVSVFRKKEDGGITRVAKDHFGPGDSYCGAWHLFSLLPDGWAGWDPQFEYPDQD